MTDVRNVYKNQALAEDLALGVGKTSQLRHGQTVEGSRINIPVPVYSFAEMSAVDPRVTNRVLLEVSQVEYVVYIYREPAEVGVPSDNFPGRWVPQNIQSSIVLATSSADAITVDGNNHNQYITLTSAIGSVVTVGRAERDIGFGIMPFVPSLVFIHGDTNGQVLIMPAAGVTVDSPATYTLAKRSSVVALIAIAVDRWVLLGDIKVV